MKEANRGVPVVLGAHLDISSWEVMDAFQQREACPFCALKASLEEDFVAHYYDEMVMDDAYQGRILEEGLCGQHLTRLERYPDRLGLALTLQTLLKRSQQLLATRNLAAVSQVDSCPACQWVQQELHRFMLTAAELFGQNPGFAAVLHQAHPMCLAHLSAFAQVAQAHLRPPRRQQLLTALANKERAVLAEISQGVEAFIRSYDYRQRAQPVDPKAVAAVAEALNLLRGSWESRRNHA